MRPLVTVSKVEHPSLKITQHLWFEKDMEAALRFYVSLIPGSSLDLSRRYQPDT